MNIRDRNKLKRCKTRTGCFLLAAALAGPGAGVAGASTGKSDKAPTNLPIGKEDKFRETLPKDYKPTDLVSLAPDLAYEKGRKLELRDEAAKAMEQMAKDAAKEGLSLKVVSAYRDFAHQNRLYESALKRYGKNQKMVGRPGRSEHFLGTTVDVCNTNPKHLLKADFSKSAEYEWLEANAEDYGWKFTVRAGKNGRTAAQDEPWHLRFVGAKEAPASDDKGKSTTVADAGSASVDSDKSTPADSAKSSVDSAKEVASSGIEKSPDKVAAALDRLTKQWEQVRGRFSVKS